MRYFGSPPNYWCLSPSEQRRQMVTSPLKFLKMSGNDEKTIFLQIRSQSLDFYPVQIFFLKLISLFSSFSLINYKGDGERRQ